VAVSNQYAPRPAPRAPRPSLLTQSTVDSSVRHSQNCEPQTYVFGGKINFVPEASLYCLQGCMEIRVSLIYSNLMSETSVFRSFSLLYKHMKRKKKKKKKSNLPCTCRVGLRGNRSRAPLILYPGSRWRWMTKFTPRPIDLRERTPLSTEKEGGWFPEPVWAF